MVRRSVAAVQQDSSAAGSGRTTLFGDVQAVYNRGVKVAACRGCATTASMLAVPNMIKATSLM
jgi:hypothetical protein